MPLIPTQADTDLPTFKVLANGEDLGGTVAVESVQVVKKANKIATARLTLLDGSVALEDFEVSAGASFVPGAEVEIQAGYHNEEDPIFKGIVIRHSIKTGGESSKLILDLKDAAVKMTVGRHNKYFQEVTDSDIIEELIGTYGLESDVEATEVTHQSMVQYFSTDWDFVLSRAEVNGKLVFVDDGKVSVKKPDLSASPLVTLAYGHNVFEFEAGMDARDQFAASTTTSWSATNQEVSEGEGADPGLTEQGNFSATELADVIGLDAYAMQHGGHRPDDELKAWADAKLLRSRLAKIQGKVKIQGFSDIKPGDVIELEGFGDRFNGVAFVSGVQHAFSAATNWFTTIDFGLCQDWFAHVYQDILDKPANGLLPAIHGLQIGIVTNIHEDPDGEERIKVRLPLVNQEEEGVWARVATLDAGDARGTIFRPEVEDEVIVGFLNDDPRDPVILGMMHSSAKPSPLPPEEDNNEKGIVTRDELKLLFNDDLKSITIETPNGNKLVFSDDEGGITLEDENQNKVALTSDGINIESAADINIVAGGDLNLEGVNVSVAASAQFTAEGGSGTEVSSSGISVLKGSIVQIN